MTVAFRQHATDRYAEAPTVVDGIRDHLTHACAECGADLTADDGAPIVPAALFVYPPDDDRLTLAMSPASRVTAYACPTCLHCAPIVAARLAASLDDGRRVPDVDDSTPAPCYDCGRELAAHPASDCRDYQPDDSTAACYCGRPAGPHPVSAHGPSLAQLTNAEPR